MEDIAALREKALKTLETIDAAEALEAWRVSYLGRKSVISRLFNTLAEKSLEEKKIIGPHINHLKKELEQLYAKKVSDFRARRAPVDITGPGKRPRYGHLHPLTLVQNDIKRIFGAMNFTVVEGSEIETDYYNFDALNIPKNHPARDLWDTFWINREKGWLMRTHTSPVQIRYMEKHAPPIRIIVPGRVFRYEATDSSHEINFYQFEGLMVGADVSFAHFKWVVTEFCRQFFGKTTEIRFRPSYFPFTEPSVEVDIRMGGKWLEVMGAGMVHPKVFEAVGYSSTGSGQVRGFAFGGGMDRFAMIKYGIPDIRLFYNGDLRFTQQF